jgi:hypothetical protein
MPDNQQTDAAPMDALLLAQSLWRQDHEATAIITGLVDPVATNRELANWLRVAVQKALEYGAGPECGDTDEFAVIARWISGAPQPAVPL